MYPHLLAITRWDPSVTSGKKTNGFPIKSYLDMIQSLLAYPNSLGITEFKTCLMQKILGKDNFGNYLISFHSKTISKDVRADQKLNSLFYTFVLVKFLTEIRFQNVESVNER